MGKSRHKNFITDEEEIVLRRRPKNKQNKHKERRIQRALKTKNVYEYLRYNEIEDDT